MNEKILRPNLIFETITGSRSYGTSMPESDIDTRGIIFSPKTHVFGIEKFEQFQGFKDDDKVWFELRFCFNLMAANNPNMIDFLYTPESNWTHSTKYWEKIMENRDLFLSKRAKFTYSGFAIAQLKRIESHRKWLLNGCPFTEKPKRTMYGLPAGHKNIPKEQLKAILAIEPRFMDEGVRDEAIAEKKYNDDLKLYNAYIEWKKNRNPVRAMLETKCGYDAKHAGHLIRLIRMGKEILATGTVNVDRSNIDADYLLNIRQGNVKWDNIICEVKTMDDVLNALYETSTLQHSPDRKKINDLSIELYEEFYS